MTMKTLLQAPVVCASILVISLLLAPPSVLPQSKVGTTAAQFLGIGVGPRAIAMGGAYVASNEDVTAMYWNPGAFVQASKTQFMFSNSQWLVGTKFRWFGFMLNIDEANSAGLSVTQLDYGEDEITTTTQPDGTGQTWSAQDIAIALSYARRLTDHFSLGGSGKYVLQSIYNESASTMTFDLGLLFVTGFHNMRLGMSMANFGGDLTLDGRDLFLKVDVDPNNPGGNKTITGKLKVDSWPMPLLYRIGLALDVVKSDEMNLTVAADAIRPSDNVQTVNAGGEIGWRDMLFLRGGYKSMFSTDSEEGLTLGAGIKYRMEGLGALEFDYAFNKFGVFDNLNTIAVAIAF